MNKRIKLIILSIFLLGTIHLSATKYAGEIFRMGSGVRNFALGNCGISDVDAYGLAYWNPALIAKTEGNKFELMHAEEYMGLLTYDTFSAIWNKQFSVVITRIGIDDIPLTKVPNDTLEVGFDNRPYKYKSVNNSDFVVYLGFYRKIGNYHIGLTPKFAYRHLAEENGFGFGADISSFYEFLDNLLIAFKIRDFFSTQILWGNGTHEIVNPGFDLESNYKFLMPLINLNSQVLAGTEIHTDGRKETATIAAGFLSFDFHFGLEVNLHKNADVYFGYDVDNFTTGLSLKIKNKWKINYSFEQDSEDLENSHRISIGLNL